MTPREVQAACAGYARRRRDEWARYVLLANVWGAKVTLDQVLGTSAPGPDITAEKMERMNERLAQIDAVFAERYARAGTIEAEA